MFIKNPDLQPPKDWFTVVKDEDKRTEQGQYASEFNKLSEGKVANWMEIYQLGNQGLLGTLNWRQKSPPVESIIEAEQGIVNATTFTPARLEVERVKLADSWGSGKLIKEVFLEGIEVGETGNPVASGLRAVVKGYIDRGGETSSLLRDMSATIYPVEAVISVQTEPPYGGAFQVEVNRKGEETVRQSGAFGSTLDFAGKQPQIDKLLGMAGRQVTSLLEDVRSLATSSLDVNRTARNRDEEVRGSNPLLGEM